MVTKDKKTGTKKGRVKVTKLQLNKETIKGLSASEQKQIKGGVRVLSNACGGTSNAGQCASVGNASC